jgi:hypothetical protein
MKSGASRYCDQRLPDFIRATLLLGTSQTRDGRCFDQPLTLSRPFGPTSPVKGEVNTPSPLAGEGAGKSIQHRRLAVASPLIALEVDPAAQKQQPFFFQPLLLLLVVLAANGK